ncbi:hypothetical protein ACTXT7_009148 [Hymenolepis weldensis]
MSEIDCLKLIKFEFLMKLLCFMAASSASAEQGRFKYKAGGYLEPEPIDMNTSRVMIANHGRSNPDIVLTINYSLRIVLRIEDWEIENNSCPQLGKLELRL